VCFEEDFLNHKPKELMGETWSEFFMNPLTYPDKSSLEEELNGYIWTM
jgi:hypothetical protein